MNYGLFDFPTEKKFLQDLLSKVGLLTENTIQNIRNDPYSLLAPYDTPQEQIQMLWDFSPGGATEEAIKQTKEGNYGMAALNAGDAALDVTPVGKFIPPLAGLFGIVNPKSRKALLDASDELTDAATGGRRGSGKVKERLGKGGTGQYVGAPRGVDSPEKLAAMRDDYISQVEAGLAGADWYTDASNWIQYVSPNQAHANKAATSFGATSQGANVNVNTGFGIKGNNQFAAGVPVRTGRFPGTASPQIEMSYSGQDVFLGPKLDPFRQNVSVAWNPDLAKHPVHDIWQGRAFGYVMPDGKPWNAGFSPQQHAFMDEQMKIIIDDLNRRKVGGRDDWDALKAQAAAWTGAKIRAGDLTPADAAKHYGDFAGGYTAFGTHEQVPGAGIGHLPNMVDEPFDVRAAYSADPRSSWLNENGQDALYGDMGLLTPEANQSIGAYTPQSTGILEVNPAVASRSLVTDSSAEGIWPSMMTMNKKQLGGYKPPQWSYKTVRPESRSLLDSAEATRAYVDAQNAGAWSKPIAGNKAGWSDSLFVPMDSALTEKQMKDLTKLADDNGMFVIDTGRGVEIVSYDGKSGTELGKQLKKQFGKDLDTVLGPGIRNRVSVDTGYVDYEDAWGAQGTGAATRRLLGILDMNPKIFDALDRSPTLRAKAAANLARDAEYAAKMGVPIRDDIQRARAIIAEHGLTGLRDALKNGAILPAALVGILPFLESEEGGI